MPPRTATKGLLAVLAVGLAWTAMSRLTGWPPDGGHRSVLSFVLTVLWLGVLTVLVALSARRPEGTEGTRRERRP